MADKINFEKHVKAIVLLSGGLDSMLAVRVLQEQGIEVSGLVFTGCFFGAQAAKTAAKQLGIKLKVIDFARQQLAVVKNPKHGYGRNMNPCVDCHALMLKLAKQEMIKRKYDFLATGEVLGERPMSQNKKALGVVEREADLAGYLLRPLSAKLLLPTIPEADGRVDRDKLLAISGRRRVGQIALAKKYGIDSYPSPAGGCLLTDPGFSERLKILLERYPGADPGDIELLKYGRHIWRQNGSKSDFEPLDVLFIIGRDKEENEILEKLASGGDFLAEAAEIPGPLILIRNFCGKKLVKEKLAGQVGKFLVKYNNKAKNFDRVNIKWHDKF